MAARTIPAPRRTPYPKGRRTVTLATVSRAVTLQDEYIVVDTTLGDVTLTWPAIANSPIGRKVTIVDAGGGNNVLHQPAAADSIGGGGAGVLYNQTADSLTAATFTADGTTTWESDAISAAISSMVGQTNVALGQLTNLLRVFNVDPLGVEALGVRSTLLKLQSGTGNDVGENRVVTVKVFDDAGLTTPSVNAVAAVGAKGTALAGDGSNSAVMKTDGNGQLDIDVTDGVGGASHWLVIAPMLPLGDNTDVLWQGCHVQTAAWA